MDDMAGADIHRPRGAEAAPRGRAPRDLRERIAAVEAFGHENHLEDDRVGIRTVKAGTRSAVVLLTLNP